MTVTLITIIHLFICVFLISIVLLQQGKGADAGATFGGGGNTVFGASGADTFLTKVTTFVAVCFMFTSVVLAVRGQGAGESGGALLDDLTTSVPAASDKPALEVVPDAATAEKLEDAAANVAENVGEVADTAAVDAVDASAEAADGTAKAVGEVAEQTAEVVSEEAAKVEAVANEATETPQVEASPTADPKAAAE